MQTNISHRMRSAASVLLRAACLLKTDAVVHFWTTRDGMILEDHASDFAMSALIRKAHEQLFPNVCVDDESSRVPAVSWALAMIDQTPADRSPDVADLVAAAKWLREFAEYADFLNGFENLTAVARVTNREVAA